MANGKTGSLTWTSGYFSVQVNWSEAYDISSNVSNVTIDSIKVKSSGYYGPTYYPNGTIKINGTTKALNTTGKAAPTINFNVLFLSNFPI